MVQAVMARLWLSVLLVIALGAGAVAWLIARPGDAPHGYSGLEFSQMTKAAALRAPLLSTRGALVERVAEKSPGAQAGIEVGAVVAEIDGVKITSARQASMMVRKHGAGDRVVFTLIDEARGAIHPKKVAVVFAAAPPEDKSIFRVKPPRTLAKEHFNPPGMAANASWSHRLAHGVSTRPRAMPELDAGDCSGVAPEQWRVLNWGKGMIHLASKDGAEHAVYKLVALSAAQKNDPKGYVTGLVHAIFHSMVTATPTETWKFGVRSFNFGNSAGTAGLALWRLNGDILSVWIAGVPASEIVWAMPVTAGALLSLQCKGKLAPPSAPRDPALVATSVSSDCLQGNCRDSDFAATYLQKYRLGYVHAHDGEVFLIDPKRDLWLNGQDGPGFYRQLGGENEKLMPGRTN
ncbi:MAG TPA: PDZ domain-containing protein [Rhizomicrobium sp.]|nr:PDZ domain-containing protein [Rhizomicrobium sp.]